LTLKWQATGSQRSGVTLLTQGLFTLADAQTPQRQPVVHKLKTKTADK
jgi:hypothetical protein